MSHHRLRLRLWGYALHRSKL